jgi:hypothetical protein
MEGPEKVPDIADKVVIRVRRVTHENVIIRS